jgi:hypothetical protein
VLGSWHCLQISQLRSCIQKEYLVPQTLCLCSLASKTMAYCSDHPGSFGLGDVNTRLDPTQTNEHSWMNELVAGTEGSSHNPQCQPVSPTTEASIFAPNGLIGETRLAALNTVGQYGTCDGWFEQMPTPCGDVQNQRRIGSSSGDTIQQPLPSWHGFGSGLTSLGNPFHNDEDMNDQPRSGHDSYPQSTRSN